MKALFIILLFSTVAAGQMHPRAQQLLIASTGNTIASKEVVGLQRLSSRLYIASKDGATSYTGLASKFYIWYPCIGSALNSIKWNLINTANFTITANGTPTYSGGVVTMNGTSNNLSTNFTPNSNGTQNMGMGIYSATNYGSTGTSMGATANSSSTETSIWINDGGTFYCAVGSNEFTTANSTALGIYAVQRTAAAGAGSLVSYKNGSLLGSYTSTFNGLTMNAILIGAMNNVASNPANRTPIHWGGGWISNTALTAGQVSEAYTIQNNFNNDCGK